MNVIKLFKMVMGMAISIVTLTNCSSTMKCYVTGEPETKIFTSDGKYLGEIPFNGIVEIKIDRKDNRHDFLIAQQKPDSPIIPIGLNYSKRHNAFREFIAGIFTIPTLWISAATLMKYYDRWDANDQLILNKSQKSNEDLLQTILQSPSPLDEISEMEIGSAKSKKNNRSKQKTEANLINKTGKFEKCLSLSTINPLSGDKKTINFAGEIITKCSKKSGNSLRVIGKLKPKEEPLDYTIGLKGGIKKDGDKYKAVDKFGNDVIISCLNNGNYCLSFVFSGFNVELEFDPKSFVNN